MGKQKISNRKMIQSEGEERGDVDKVEKDSFGSGPPLTWLTSPPPTSQSDRSPSVLYGCFLCKTFWERIGGGFQFSVTTSHFAVSSTRVYTRGQAMPSKGKIFQLSVVTSYFVYIGESFNANIFDKIGRDFHSLGLRIHHKQQFLPVLAISHWEAKNLT